MDKFSKLIIGIGGHVVAIDKLSGDEIWRTKLKSSAFVTVYQSDTHVYAGVDGVLFCLDFSNGQILWQCELKGLGMGVIACAMPVSFTS